MVPPPPPPDFVCVSVAETAALVALAATVADWGALELYRMMSPSWTELGAWVDAEIKYTL